MDACQGRGCCRIRECGKVKSTLLCSPSTVLCSTTSEPITPSWSPEIPSFASPVVSGKNMGRPVRSLRDPVFSAKKIVAPVRLSGGRNYVDASKFNRNYLPQAISIPIAKCRSPHVSSCALGVIDRRQDKSVTPSCCPMSEPTIPTTSWSPEIPSFGSPLMSVKKIAKDSLTFDNEDALNTTVSSVGNYVKPKKNRGKRKTKDAVCGSDAVIFALKHKVRSLQ